MFFAFGVSTQAVPVRPGIKKVLTLADGTAVAAELKGDEYMAWWETADGRKFVQSESNEKTFVNHYLPLAPDLKRDYNVWIARYGEYKPDVHLVFWQLCPDGRVSGIRPKVDINVFNGYRSEFDDFCKNQCIR